MLWPRIFKLFPYLAVWALAVHAAPSGDVMKIPEGFGPWTNLIVEYEHLEVAAEEK